MVVVDVLAFVVPDSIAPVGEDSDGKSFNVKILFILCLPSVVNVSFPKLGLNISLILCISRSGIPFLISTLKLSSAVLTSLSNINCSINCSSAFNGLSLPTFSNMFCNSLTSGVFNLLNLPLVLLKFTIFCNSSSVNLDKSFVIPVFLLYKPSSSFGTPSFLNVGLPFDKTSCASLTDSSLFCTSFSNCSFACDSIFISRKNR